MEEAHKISLHAIIGSISSRTMRVLEKIREQLVVNLVDTHNFPTLISKAWLSPNSREEIKVNVANGEMIIRLEN